MAMAGTVKFFNAERGYGFIKPDDGGRDVFVRHRGRTGRAQVADRGTAHLLDVEPDKGKGRRRSTS
jgi:CspA family cold shock protein